MRWKGPITAAILLSRTFSDGFGVTTSEVHSESESSYQRPDFSREIDMLRRAPSKDRLKSSRSLSPGISGTTDENSMVPITYEFLVEHYKQFEDPSLSSELKNHSGEVAALQVRIMGTVPKSAVILKGEGQGQLVHETLKMIMSEDIPTGLDNSMYKIRLACEEAAERCEVIKGMESYAHRFLGIARKFEGFQDKQKEHVSAVIAKYLPQDFRGNMFHAIRQRSERNNQSAIDDVVARGGSLRDKYDLLWDQQWKRRENLAMIGNATGVWKWLVRYLAGVPEPLLAFAKQINSKRGPTEALRAKFGGSLKELARFSIELDGLCTAASATSDEVLIDKTRCQLEKSLGLYETEVDKFVQLLEKVIVSSPFFVSPEEIDGNSSR